MSGYEAKADFDAASGADEEEREEMGAEVDAPLPNPPGAMLMDRVLLAVRRARVRQDERNGILRDYRDGTAGTRFHGPAISIDKAAVAQAKRDLAEAQKAGMRSWRHYLELAIAEAFAESDESRLQAKLLEVAAVSCAWVEGIHIRADDRRIALEQKASMVKDGKVVRWADYAKPVPWWRRLLRALRLQ